LSDHFDGRRFFNPIDRHGRNPTDFLRWMFTRAKQPWPRWIDDPPQPPPPRSVPGGSLAATFVNHSTILLQTDGVAVLTDPIWSQRASPFLRVGPARVRKPGVAFEHLPKIDVVLVSHNHYDHLDLTTLRRLQAAFAPTIVTSLGNRRFLERHGLLHVHELDWWQAIRFGPLEITLTPAQHFAARGLLDRNRTLWGGFLIRSSERIIYFAADTAYPGPFADVRSRVGSIDLALLPFAAYEPRWFMRASHMNPEEAVHAHLDLGGPFSIGMHFGTFQLTDEPIDEPERHLRIALEKCSVTASQFRVPAFGETVWVPALASDPAPAM
jgi:L-ascorbate metabolism protein UlaG (beta-lactamase superfamily)